jgi:succinoglycan biosynthesis protein ExoV
MKLRYCHVEDGNFGDDMNTWFWDEVFPDHANLSPDRVLLGIGSLLWDENLEPGDRITVMGSGTGVGRLPTFPLDHVDFAFVRGPKTAREFRLPAETAIADPAILVSRIPSVSEPLGDRSSTVFIPHCGTDRLPLDWQRLCEAAGMVHVSPRDESRSVIRRIAGAQRVITESLHGAIVAEAFRVPWTPIAINPAFGVFKWQDWAASMEIDLEISPALSRLKAAYGVLTRVRYYVRWKMARLKGAPEVKVAKPDGKQHLGSYRLGATDKSRARYAVSRFSGLIERALVSDLKRAAQARPHLARDGVLLDRQRRLLERIDAVAGDMRAESPDMRGAGSSHR